MHFRAIDRYDKLTSFWAREFFYWEHLHQAQSEGSAGGKESGCESFSDCVSKRRFPRGELLIQTGLLGVCTAHAEEPLGDGPPCWQWHISLWMSSCGAIWMVTSLVGTEVLAPIVITLFFHLKENVDAYSHHAVKFCLSYVFSTDNMNKLVSCDTTYYY